jgi:hypothetical protein
MSEGTSFICNNSNNKKKNNNHNSLLASGMDRMSESGGDIGVIQKKALNA